MRFADKNIRMRNLSANFRICGYLIVANFIFEYADFFGICVFFRMCEPFSAALCDHNRECGINTAEKFAYSEKVAYFPHMRTSKDLTMSKRPLYTILVSGVSN